MNVFFAARRAPVEYEGFFIGTPVGVPIVLIRQECVMIRMGPKDSGKSVLISHVFLAAHRDFFLPKK